MGWLQAQEREEPTKKYIVQVDSHFVKATPYEIIYEENREFHQTEDVEWYNNMTIYEYKPLDIDESGKAAQMQSLKATIILLSGGSFVSHSNQPNLNPNNTSIAQQLRLTWKLANEGFNVFWINYELEQNYASKINNLIFNSGGGCDFTENTESKARLEHASLKSFRDFRVKINQIVSDPDNNVDMDNIFIAGESAGAVLAIYAVFLDPEEIPTSIDYTDCANPSQNPPINIVTIDPTHDLRTTGYPIPAIRGIIPMAGGSLYNGIFNNNLSYTNNVAVNLMHGTCDELISQNFERVSYKFITIFPWPWTAVYNTQPIQRYPLLHGSKILYNSLIQNHNKIGFGQVINGGHAPFNTQANENLYRNGGWDVYIPTNLNAAISLRDPIFSNILTFVKRVKGEIGFPTWNNHAYSVFPDRPTSNALCKEDDLSLLNPPIDATNVTCGSGTGTATVLPYLPYNGTGVSVVWSVSSNLQIVGSNTNFSVTYLSSSTTSSTGTLTAAITYNQRTVTVSKQISIVIPSFPDPVPTPVGYDTVCFFDKFLTLTNLPPSASVTWASTGNIAIYGPTNQSTVSYGRINNQVSAGILTATIATPCSTRVFNYTIYTFTGTCRGGFFLLVNPNPAAGMIELSLWEDETISKVEGKWELQLVDITGTPVIKTYFEGSRQQINISHLSPGQYKAILKFDDEVLFANFNISR